ncbi:polyphenol oxidase I, chloroplastic-like [Coffea eugenioides]|uniref:polyphenol oxidase I, chloroplastic-like n=1 Tax=Coffea eugenioides TaxID=49369 RepID=UPI000F61001E|nr:polyphenol oxidase I, chloroplastic-like [Coffea eugenioides]
MAFFSLPSLTHPIHPTPVSSFSLKPLICSSSPGFFSHPFRPTRVTNQKSHAEASTCKAQKADHHQNPSTDDSISSSKSKCGKTSAGKFERRDVLLGLGGLYAATTLGTKQSSLALPVSPDIFNCTEATETRNGIPINCCPPSAAGYNDYTPSASEVYTRMPAHAVSHDYVKKYSSAITKMKNLSMSDPRNFYQQANVHCVYCDEGYPQLGFPDKKLEIHSSWLFFPWHRWYLYFFERICKNLLDDDTFTLPFWQWDDSSGMQIPSMFNDSKLSLYDCIRNPKHLPPKVVDLAYNGTDLPIDPNIQIQYNCCTMYTQMITQSSTPDCFFGQPLLGGNDPDPGAGSIENIPHNCVHDWVGDPSQPNNEDMGVLYAAGRDPIFYAHHANVDRMWYIYDNVLKRKNIEDPDWLNSSFIFFNEAARPVRVTVKDSTNLAKLGYTYPDLPLSWLDCKPKARRKGLNPTKSAPKASEVMPMQLEKPISFVVERPKKSRSGKEKAEAEEVLKIKGIQFDKGETVVFDVFVNEDDTSQSNPCKAESLGSFNSLAHGHSMKSTTSQCFAISEVLEELGADDFDSILVTLVPRRGAVTIGGIEITFVPKS